MRTSSEIPVRGEDRDTRLPDPRPADPLGPRRALLLLAAILVVAGGLRFWRIDAQSLWYDEVITLAESTGNYWENEALQRRNQWILPAPAPTSLAQAKPLGETVRLLENQLHPPLYYAALRLWRELLGESAAAARALSALFSLAAVALVYEAGRRLYGRESGLWAALIMAVAAPQIAFAQEVRSYALLTLAGAGAILAMVSLERSGPSWRNVSGLFLGSLAMALTHYFAAGALLALGAYALLGLQGRARRVAVGTLAASAGAFAALWGPVALRQTDALGMGDFLRTGEPFHALRTLGRFLTVPVQNLLPTGPDNVAVLLPRDYLLGAMLLLIPVLLVRRRRSLLLPWLWVAGAGGALAVLDIVRSTRHLMFVRYSLIAGVGAALLLPALLRDVKFGRHALAVLVAWIGISTYYDGYRPWKNEMWNYRALGEWVERHVPPDGRLVFQTLPPGEEGPAGRAERFARQRLRAVSHYAFSPQRAVMILNEPVATETLRPSGEASRLWVITALMEGPDPRLLPGFEVVRSAHVPMVASGYELVPADGQSPTPGGGAESTVGGPEARGSR